MKNNLFNLVFSQEGYDQGSLLSLISETETLWDFPSVWTNERFFQDNDDMETNLNPGFTIGSLREDIIIDPLSQSPPKKSFHTCFSPLNSPREIQQGNEEIINQMDSSSTFQVLVRPDISLLPLVVNNQASLVNHLPPDYDIQRCLIQNKEYKKVEPRMRSELNRFQIPNFYVKNWSSDSNSPNSHRSDDVLQKKGLRPRAIGSSIGLRSNVEKKDSPRINNEFGVDEIGRSEHEEIKPFELDSSVDNNIEKKITQQTPSIDDQELSEAVIKYSNNEDIIKHGWMRVMKRLRWVKLTRFKIEIWRDISCTKDPPQSRISLGFKMIEVLNGAIVVSNILRPQKLVILEPNDSELESWVREMLMMISQFRERIITEKQFCISNGWVAKPVKIWVGTWNVGNALPQQDLSAWIPSEADNYDIIVVGVQECKYNAHSVSEDWFYRIQNHLGNKYLEIANESLWEIRNIILIRDELAGFVHSIEKNSVATGILDRLGNKGGVGIRFCLFDTSFCMISAHLAAHMEDVESRNDDYSQIISQMKFVKKNGKNHVDVMNQHNYCFFYGDLNYRIEQSRDTVMKWITEGESSLSRLHEADQLKREQEAGRAFAGFTEGARPTFRPTYRYDRNVHDEEGRRIYSTEKGRVPSWCDRVLWRSHPGFTATRLNYQCSDSITSSDHSPVWASFVLNIRLEHSVLPQLGLHVDTPINKNALSGEGAFMKFSDLRVYTIFGRETNLYLKFNAPFFAENSKLKRTRTNVAKKTYTPVWDTIRPFPLLPLDLEYISSQQVIIVLMEETNRATPNNPIAHGVLSTFQACGINPHSFVVPLYTNGYEVGEVTGKVHVTGLISAQAKLKYLQ